MNQQQFDLDAPADDLQILISDQILLTESGKTPEDRVAAWVELARLKKLMLEQRPS